MQRLTDVVKNLIIINVLVHLAMMTLPDAFATIPLKGRMYFFLSPFFEPYQIVTSMFLHGGIGHLFMNMLGLYFIGPTVEKVLGPKRFLTLYLLAGLAGSLLHMGYGYIQYLNLPCMGWECQAYENLMTIGALGASGCVFGVVIAFTMMFPKEKLIIFPIPIPIQASYLAFGLVAFSLIAGIMDTTAGGIAHFAHLGGAIMGYIMVRYWNMTKLR